MFVRAATYSALPRAEEHELIVASLHGHHLACYVVSGYEGHVGYAKLVCGPRPEDVWDTPMAFAKVSAGPFDCPTKAIAAVRARAERVLARKGSRSRQVA